MVMNGRRRCAVGVVGAVGAALFSAVLAAQAPAPQREGQGQQDPPARPQIVPVPPPTFRTAVNLVTTDVIARDNAGQFVADLKPGEFEVFEDGVKQDVVQLLLFHGGRQYSPLTAPVQTQREGIILPPPRPTNDTAGRIFVFVIDDLHLEFRNTGRIRELFKKIRSQLVHEGDMFGIVSTGPSSIAIDMTYDMKRLDEALNKISGAGLKPSDILEGGSTSEGPSEVRYRAHVAFSVAYDLLGQLEQVHNRRKAIIYISDGYDFNPFPNSRAQAEAERSGTSNSGSGNGSDASNQAYQNAQDDPTNLFNQQGQEFAEADLARELAELTRSANRANVSFYTIDPRGLVGMPDLDETVDQSEWQDYIHKSQDSLRVLADETGGYAVVNSNDFDKALKRIDAETSDYYVLGYYSNNPDPLHRNRRIEVKVTRKDVNVWARKGYSLKSVKGKK
jgi:VWFA-related protein